MKENDKKTQNFLTDAKMQLLFQYAIWNVTVRLKEIEGILKENADRMIISYITSRVKAVDSIAEKLVRKGKQVTWESALQNLNDIVGVRAVCLFEEDIYQIRDYFYAQKDIQIIKEKDFIKKPKASGYRSLHLILEVPVACTGEELPVSCQEAQVSTDGTEQELPVRVELQLRTMAMDFWSVLEYQLQYKKKNAKARAAQEQLKACAMDIRQVEAKMYDLKKEIDRMT